MSLVDKTFGSRFKDLLVISNSNAGFDTNIDNITSGNGNPSALSLSKNNVKILPNADSTTNTVIYDKDGNALVTVDSTNDYIKLGSGQQYANTNYAYFGGSSADTIWAGMASGTHTAVPFNSNGLSGALVTMGTGTNPDTSMTISTTADDLMNCIMYIDTAIVVDAVYVWMGSDTATADTACRFHLMTYTINSGNGSTSGDLSSGVVVADGADINNAGYEQAYYQSMTIQSASVAAGQALLFLARMDSVNSDISINVKLKYHLI